MINCVDVFVFVNVAVKRLPLHGKSRCYIYLFPASKFFHYDIYFLLVLRSLNELSPLSSVLKALIPYNRVDTDSIEIFQLQ